MFFALVGCCLCPFHSVFCSQNSKVFFGNSTVVLNLFGSLCVYLHGFFWDLFSNINGEILVLRSLQNDGVDPVAQSVYRLATGWTVRGSNPGGGARFFAPVQTGPGTNPASFTVGTGSFPGVKYGQGVMLTTQPPSSAG
jgi:hypothetical protein